MKFIERLTPLAVIFIDVGIAGGGYILSAISGAQLPKDLANILVVVLPLIWLGIQGYKKVEKRNNERDAAILEKLSRPHGSISMQSIDPKFSQLHSQYLQSKEDPSKPDKEPGP